MMTLSIMCINDSAFSASFNNYFVRGHSFYVFHIYFVYIVIRLGLRYSAV